MPNCVLTRVMVSSSRLDVKCGGAMRLAGLGPLTKTGGRLPIYVEQTPACLPKPTDTGTGHQATHAHTPTWALTCLPGQEAAEHTCQHSEAGYLRPEGLGKTLLTRTEIAVHDLSTTISGPTPRPPPPRQRASEHSRCRPRGPRPASGASPRAANGSQNVLRVMSMTIRPAPPLDK